MAEIKVDRDEGAAGHGGGPGWLKWLLLLILLLLIVWAVKECTDRNDETVVAPAETPGAVAPAP